MKQYIIITSLRHLFRRLCKRILLSRSEEEVKRRMNKYNQLQVKLKIHTVPNAHDTKWAIN